MQEVENVGNTFSRRAAHHRQAVPVRFQSIDNILLILLMYGADGRTTAGMQEVENVGNTFSRRTAHHRQAVPVRFQCLDNILLILLLYGADGRSRTGTP